MVNNFWCLLWHKHYLFSVSIMIWWLRIFGPRQNPKTLSNRNNEQGICIFWRILWSFRPINFSIFLIILIFNFFSRHFLLPMFLTKCKKYYPHPDPCLNLHYIHNLAQVVFLFSFGRYFLLKIFFRKQISSKPYLFMLIQSIWKTAQDQVINMVKLIFNEL